MNIGIIILKEHHVIYKNRVADDILNYCIEKKNIDVVVDYVISKCKQSYNSLDKEISTTLSLYDICKKDVTLDITISPFKIEKLENCLLLTMRVSQCGEETHCVVKDKAELFSALTKSTKVGILVHQGEKWVYANPAIEEISGYTPEEVLKLNFWDVVHPDHVEMVREKGYRRQRGENVPPYPLKIVRKDGEVRWIYLSGNTTTLWGKPAGIISVIDITDKMVLEEKLKKREKRYRSILENMEEGYFETDLKGNIVFCNNALLRIGEVDESEDIKSINYKSFAPPKSAQKMFRVFNNVYWTGKPALIEDFDVYTRKGNLKHVEISVRLMRDDQGKPCGFSGIVRDVTEKKRLYREIKESREYYRAIFELGSSATVITDKDFNIIDANKTFEELFKVNKLLLIHNRNLRDFIDNHYIEVLHNAISLMDSLKDSIPPFELKAKNAMDGTLDLLCNLAKVESNNFYVISFMDLAPMKEVQKLNLQLEEQLRRSQRLEGIGLMASGIAHDFNNILQGIYANLLVLNQDVVSDKGKNAYSNMEQLIQRGGRIVSELLTYAKTKEEKFFAIDINNIIKDIAGLFRSTLPKNITLSLDLKKDIKNIHGDYAGIQQVVMNLIQNAVDAIGIDNSGKIYIRTTLEYISDNEIFPGEYVVMEIEDSGCGMDSSTKARIFEPFFTTKGPIKGTGLGMSIVKKIVDNHNGYIFCDSEVGRGTKFKIYFPAVSTGEKKEGSREVKLGKSKQKDIATDTIKVFFVEDEEMILEMATTFLEEMGFKVISATSGTTAIDIFERNHKDVDVVVLDINLPGISGSEVLKKIFQINPNQKVIISSGYSKESIADLRSIDKGNITFMQKPYSLEKLKETILELVNKG